MNRLSNILLSKRADNSSYRSDINNICSLDNIRKKFDKYTLNRSIYKRNVWQLIEVQNINFYIYYFLSYQVKDQTHKIELF